MTYLRARYYDPASAQFITRDPITITTRQPYSYVVDNPLNSTDPTGLFGWDTITNAGLWIGQRARSAANEIAAYHPTAASGSGPLLAHAFLFIGGAAALVTAGEILGAALLLAPESLGASLVGVGVSACLLALGLLMLAGSAGYGPFAIPDAQTQSVQPSEYGGKV